MKGVLVLVVAVVLVLVLVLVLVVEEDGVLLLVVSAVKDDMMW